MKAQRQKAHFAPLFAYMMVQLAILPIFERNVTLSSISDLAYLVLIFYTVFSIGRDRLFWLSAALFAMTALSYLAFLLNQDNKTLLVVLNALTCAFILMVIAEIVIYVLNMHVITLDGVLGGLCVYLLIGAAFTLLYLNIELLNPGSFDFGAHGDRLDFLQMYDLLFFYSFVTLLTVGYGDILPMSHFAQTLSVLQGVIGQFYIVFYVAVLVGMYLHGRQSNGESG